MSSAVRKYFPGALLLLAAAALFQPGCRVPKSSSSSLKLCWQQLSPIPDAQGYAGSFVGISGGALVVAGGANFTGDKFGTYFQKKWHDSVFVLDRPDGQWQVCGKLPRALGYGVSITTADGIICIGGSDADRHYADVFRLTWKNGSLAIAPLPALPKSCANACGTCIGDKIYIAGGLESPTATGALKTF